MTSSESRSRTTRQWSFPSLDVRYGCATTDRTPTCPTFVVHSDCRQDNGLGRLEGPQGNLTGPPDLPFVDAPPDEKDQMRPIGVRARALLLLGSVLLGAGAGGGTGSIAALSGSSEPPGTATPVPSPESTAGIDLSQLTGSIALSGGSPHAEDVYVINANGTGLIRLTDDPVAEFDPTWSPDGTSIAYRRQVTDDRTTDIYVIDANGSGERNLSGDDGAPDWGPAWSPDGDWIAWNAASDAGFGFDLGLIHPDGSERMVIKPGVFVEYPAWSPDGSQIAFMSQVAEEGSQYDIFVMGADGSDVNRLTTTRGSDGWPAWSPDGTRILFSSERDDCALSDAPDCNTTGDIGPFHTLYVMKPDGSNQDRVSDVFGQIADWSPDGRYVVFEGLGGLSIMRSDGSDLTTLPTGLSFSGFPDWSGERTP